MEVIGAWAGERYARCRGQIWLVAQQLLAQNKSIVLDGAAANKEQRDLIRQKALNHGVDFQLHYVTSGSEIRKQRVIERNRTQGDTYSLAVTPAMFAYTETYFEPPTGEELSGLIVVNT